MRGWTKPWTKGWTRPGHLDIPGSSNPRGLGQTPPLGGCLSNVQADVSIWRACPRKMLHLPLGTLCWHRGERQLRR